MCVALYRNMRGFQPGKMVGAGRGSGDLAICPETNSRGTPGTPPPGSPYVAGDKSSTQSFRNSVY